MPTTRTTILSTVLTGLLLAAGIDHGPAIIGREDHDLTGLGPGAHRLHLLAHRHLQARRAVAAIA